MIIYFDITNSRIKLLQQQNNHDYFVVDFFSESQTNSGTHGFSDMIDNLCQNSKYLPMLKAEKNCIVLPKEVVGLGYITVPYSRREQEKHFFTKFDSLYGEHDGYNIWKTVYANDKVTTTYLFYMAKKLLIDSIKEIFAQYGIKISSISFFESAFTEHILAKSKLAKHNCAFVLQNNHKVSCFAISKGMIVGWQEKMLDNDGFADSYVKHIKSNQSDKTWNAKVIQNDNASAKNSASITEKSQNTQQFLLDFQNYFKTTDLNIQFEKVLFVGENLYLKNLETSMKYLATEFDEKEILSHAKKDFFLETKKKFFGIF